MRCKVVRGTFILGGGSKKLKRKSSHWAEEESKSWTTTEGIRASTVCTNRVSGFEQNKCEWEQEGGQEWECRVRPSLVALM